MPQKPKNLENVSFSRAIAWTSNTTSQVVLGSLLWPSDRLWSILFFFCNTVWIAPSKKGGDDVFGLSGPVTEVRRRVCAACGCGRDEIRSNRLSGRLLDCGLLLGQLCGYGGVCVCGGREICCRCIRYVAVDVYWVEWWC